MNKYFLRSTSKNKMKTYLEFIEESRDALEKISSSWERKHPGMKFTLERGRSNNIRLAKIEVPKEKRGKGIGSRAIKGLTRYADKTGSTVSLTPEPEKGYKTKLDKMYSSHGFEKNKGKKKDYSVSDSMVRQPKKNQ